MLKSDKLIIPNIPLRAASVYKEVTYYFDCPVCGYRNRIRPEPKKAISINHSENMDNLKGLWREYVQ